MTPLSDEQVDEFCRRLMTGGATPESVPSVEALEAATEAQLNRMMLAVSMVEFAAQLIAQTRMESAIPEIPDDLSGLLGPE